MTRNELSTVKFDKERLRVNLANALDTFGIFLALDQIDVLLEHLRLVLEKNEVLNLTSIRDPRDGVILHVLDSAILVPVLLASLRRASESSSNGSFQGHLYTYTGEGVLDLQNASQSLAGLSYVDMGTGAGFPGIPLGILTPMRGVLVDSVGKKVNACSEFINQLALDSSLRAVHARLEDFAVENKGQYDFVFARALAPLDVLVEYGSPLLHRGGHLVFSKGHTSDEEIANADYTASLCGVSCVSRETFELPSAYGHREVFIFEKISKAKIKLPRKNGEARRNPLSNRQIQ